MIVKEQTGPDFSKIFENAELLPNAVNEQENSISFMHMSAEGYRDSSFLDRRAKVKAYYSAPIDSMLNNYSQLRSQLPPQPTHLVLYNGYCGSTLLSRLIHELPGCHVTKEPEITYWLSNALLNAKKTPHGSTGEIADMLYYLLTRRWENNHAMFLKLPSANTIIADNFLQLNQANTAIYLYSGRKEFLLSYMKNKERKSEARQFHRMLSAYADKVNLLEYPLPNINTCQRPDVYCIASLWILYSLLYMRLLKRFTSDRISCCDSETFFHSPDRVLRGLAKRAGSTITESDLNLVTNSEVSTTYSKNPNKQYSSGTRAEEMQLEYEKNMGIIDEGLSFINSYEARLSTPFHFDSKLD
jgi:hypothetical protein